MRPSDMENLQAQLEALQAENRRLQADHAREIEQMRVEQAKNHELQVAMQRMGQIGYWEFDLLTGSVVWSEEVYRIFGRDPALGPPTYEEYRQGIHPDDAAGLFVKIQTAIERGDPYGNVARILQPDGQIRYTRGTGQALLDAEGKPIRLFGTIQDITESKQQEAWLTYQKQFLEKILARRPLPEIFEELILELERQYPQMIGSILLIKPGTNLLHVGAGPHLPKALNQAVEGIEIGEGIGSCGTAAYRKQPVITGDIASDPLWAPYRHLVLPYGLRACWSYPVLSATEDVFGTFAMYYRAPRTPNAEEQRVIEAASQLVSIAIESRRTERALHQSEHRFQAFMVNCPIIAYIQDVDGRVVFVNRAFEAAHDMKLEEIQGRPFEERWPEEVSQQLRANNRRVLEENRPMEFEEITPKHGGQRHWLTHKFPLTDESGAALIGGMGIEITDRKRLEEQLLQALKLESIGRLAGGVAHDFNNILTAMLGFTELALSETPAGIELHNYLTNILQAGERAAGLTRQLLAFARKQIIAPVPLHLRDLILQTDQILRRLIGEHIELTMHLEEQQGWIRADAGQMQQVLLNLVINARDAMPEGGKVQIEARDVVLDEEYARRHVGVEPGDYVLLAVSDTGAGLEKSVQEHIFEPFYTTKQSGQGTGLGLATCYGIVKQNGGHIWVYSEPGQGATFKIYLPRISASQDPAHLPQTAPAPEGRETILLVEDEPMVRAMAAQTLVSKGYRVLEAGDGNEALRLAEQYPQAIDLLLTDVVLPQMSGPQVAERLCALRPGIRVLYASGYTETGIVSQGRLAADVAFLEKPYTLHTLAKKVRETLDAPVPPTATGA
ncbi:MAG TPA: ATP-binding protein [Chthonomonadaceae bacterium]|nr:ATP-binding protein [Chthonomonadaceae bacterium]